ncbi:uncharacterized protein KIAA2013 homolog [Oppia nitens]|uniref:uncharacterized protein KIAA2013 homolog n=1 Tax=Oppia nitens TaxID=1686743 RepID=UPI0023D9B28D|nr:uncharacterized protein KIAA2013 homolog [Oppia nitens]
MAIFDTIDIYLRRFKRFDKYYSGRRLLLLIIIILVIILYVIPLVFNKLWTKSANFADHNIECVERHIKPYENEENIFDTKIWKSYEIHENGNHLLPYVGNGKFAIGVQNSENSFYIKGKRALDLNLPFHPIVDIDSFGADSRHAEIIHFKDGIVNRITCFDYLRKSASIKHTFYAHRLIPTLFIQEIRITNPTDVPLIVKLNRKGWTGNSNMKVQSMVVPNKAHKEYSLLVGQLDASQWGRSNKVIAVVIAYSQLLETIEVDSHSSKTILMQTFINYTTPSSLSQIAAKVPDLKVSVRENVKKVLELSSTAIERYHINMWNQLWNSGFGISYSKAPNALNGDVINATLYYVLSQKNTFPVHSELVNVIDFGHPLSHNKELLYSPDHCYTGHSTLLASTLWSKLDTISDINRIASLWLLTLEKQGCHNLINSGAQGVMQAMVLSMASLQFTKNHLEFNSHPNELHRNYYIRRVVYGNETLINITVALQDNNKAQIFVSLEAKNANKHFYACDGGCLDAPIGLSYIPKEFPVKLTEPMTAILYITPDEQHIKDLKHTIHVKEIIEAPAHEHEVIAVHRFGTSYGGLPTIFWVLIVFLIVIFHVFLAKLIYNEYFGASASSVPYERLRQNRYAM